MIQVQLQGYIQLEKIVTIFITSDSSRYLLSKFFFNFIIIQKRFRELKGSLSQTNVSIISARNMQKLLCLLLRQSIITCQTPKVLTTYTSTEQITESHLSIYLRDSSIHQLRKVFIFQYIQYWVHKQGNLVIY